MNAGDLAVWVTPAVVIGGAVWNALATHRVHVQFNSRFDQLITAAEVRGAAMERKAMAQEIAKNVMEAKSRAPSVPTHDT